MHALVTGGAGFVGSALTRALLEQGSAVRVLDNFSGGISQSLPEGAETIRGDLRDLETVSTATKGVDVVFHQAAVRSVPRSIEEPLEFVQCNVVGTTHVLMAAEENQVKRVVFASSSSVYGSSEEPINREDARPNPLSPYAASKLAGESLCHSWTTSKGLSTISLRYFNVFGPGQRPESKYSAVFPAFVERLRRGEAPVVYGDGTQTRDFTYIDDVVRANILAATVDTGAEDLAINIGGGHPRSVNEVLDSVSAELGVFIPARHESPRTGDLPHSRADIDRAKRLLGWEPQADWSEAIRATVGWLTAEIDRAR